MDASPHPTLVDSSLPIATEGYRPLFELGRGGMSRVYLAERSVGLRKLVVLKVLEPSLTTSSEMRNAFRREAVLCARLNHPNIVQVFEVHEDTTTPMMVMEYVDGITLSQVLTRADGRLPLRLHVHVIIQALAGLHYFHELRGDDGEAEEPVHRDVSPQNVMVMHEGAVKVLDFGIAKVQGAGSEDMTKAGIIKGKLSYMPAEQLSGDQSIDRRADIFSAGVMLWEAFARRRLWAGFSQHEMVQALISGNIPQIRVACPHISPAWERIIMRAVAARREDRYATALELQVDAENNMAELGGLVQQRELATFMKSEFAELRSERRRLVDSEVRKAPVPLAVVLNGPATEVRALSMTPSGQSGTLQRSVEQARSRKPWVVLIAALGALVLGLGIKLRAASSENTPATVPTTQEQKLVTVSVAASPVDAVVLMDGKPVGNNPWTTRLVKAERSALIEITAPGYRSFSREVQLSSDVSLSVTLEPQAAASASPPANAGVADAPPSRSGRSRGPKGRPVLAPVAPAPAAPAPKANCTPPYTLDAEGVKTFKPECM
jgi:eukaryotic-like serine/threonine-protein kinase